MNFRFPVSMAIFALALAWPKSTDASTPTIQLSTSAFLPADTLASLRALSRSLEDKLGYALIEQLDQIAASDEYQTLVLLALRELSHLDSNQIARATDAFEFEDLLTPNKNHRLRPLTARTFAALTATFELMSSPILEDFIIELDRTLETGESLGAAVVDRKLPTRVRRYLRHIFRGSVALICLPFVAPDESLRLALFAHAAVGVETNLRVVAAMAPEQHRAAADGILRELRLEPIDLEALARRQDQLNEARESLREARAHVPDFRLPPDPALQD